MLYSRLRKISFPGIRRCFNKPPILSKIGSKYQPVGPYICLLKLGKFFLSASGPNYAIPAMLWRCEGIVLHFAFTQKLPIGCIRDFSQKTTLNLSTVNREQIIEQQYLALE